MKTIKEKIPDILFIASILFVSLYIALTSCTTQHKINRINLDNQHNKELTSLIDSWWICVENPGNNLPGEKRYFRKAIFQTTKNK